MPSSTTVAQARTLLSRYTGQGNVFVDRLNLACERLVKSGNWRSTKDAVVFQVYLRDDNTAFITLPRVFNTVEAAVVFRFQQQDDNTRRCGFPMAIRDSWFSFLDSGPGYTTDARFRWGNGFIPENDRFTTFKDWVIPAKLRFKFAATEANGGIINVRGLSGGQPIYTGSGASTIEGENLTIAGSTTLTTTSSFDLPPYGLVKPTTYGVVSMYTFDGVTETLVARYDPTETVPQWRRYQVPACSGWTESDPGQFLAICKREWVTVSSDYDTVIPGNLGALRFGLSALLREDAEDFTKAQQYWGAAMQLLANEVEDDVGDNTHVPVQVQDTFMIGTGQTYMGPVPDGSWPGGSNGWAGGWSN